MLKVLRRFFLKIEPQRECWEWLGAKGRTGYSSCYNGEKVMQASRYLYQIIHGDIPPGFTIDHLCFNKGCVNPWHLEAVTIGENVRRGNSILRGRTKFLLRAEAKIGLPIKAFLLQNRDSGKSYRDLGKELGVSSQVVGYWCRKLDIFKATNPVRFRAPSHPPNYHRKVLPSDLFALRKAYGDWTLQQMATHFGISRERVRQLLKKAGLRTRHTLVPINAPEPEPAAR